jgi:hypothetical protein
VTLDVITDVVKGQCDTARAKVGDYDCSCDECRLD